MKTVLYYFTGTGNSLAAAKKIAAGLDECELIAIPSMNETAGDVVPPAERVGIISPVYFSGLPAMVALFAARLDLSGVKYPFAVLTHGGGGAGAALAQLDGILKNRSGTGLSAGYGVTMPGNYILMYDTPSVDKCEHILAAADRELEKITGEVAGCLIHPPSRSFITSFLYRLIYPWFIRTVHEKDRKFIVGPQCTSCGICAAVCPADNIRIVDTTPVWNHRCELCCGCIHHCPVQAIQVGKKTAGKARYINPGISVRELFLRAVSPGKPR